MIRPSTPTDVERGGLQQAHSLLARIPNIAIRLEELSNIYRRSAPQLAMDSPVE
jgi:hypothetical protein